MKQFAFLFIIFSFISCSNDDSGEEQSTTESDILEITYKGYYQVYFEEPYQTETYSNITVTPIIEQVSSTETINLLKIKAISDGDTKDYISFKVLTNTIGDNALYNDAFSFRSYGASYFPSNFNFEVLVNNDTEFKANFSGELEHWYQGALRYVHLDITSASISIVHE